MRIISWNIRYGNSEAKNLISYALTFKPDILCLQELDSELIPWIRNTYPHYFVYGCLEVSHTDPHKQRFLCTVTNVRADRINVINYDQTHQHSIYEKLFFGKLHHWTERHAALVITVPLAGVQLRIVNLHLSAADSAHERITAFRYIVRNLRDLAIPTVFCGDFNIIDNMFYRLSLGWMLNYSRGDYRISERRVFERIFQRFGFVNIFRNMSTYMFPWKGWQLDHILVSEYVRVSNYIIGKKRFNSDHRMILVDITNAAGHTVSPNIFSG